MMNQNKILIVLIISVVVIAIVSLIYYLRTTNTISEKNIIQPSAISSQIPNTTSTIQKPDPEIKPDPVIKPVPAMNPAVYVPITPEPALPPICDADIYWDVPTNIACPDGKKLRFTKFLYGRPSDSRCPDSGGRGCMQLDLTPQANALIQNNEFKQTGAVSSWRGFSDHCQGIQKQVDIEYACT